MKVRRGISENQFVFDSHPASRTFCCLGLIRWQCFKHWRSHAGLRGAWRFLEELRQVHGGVAAVAARPAVLIMVLLEGAGCPVALLLAPHC